MIVCVCRRVSDRDIARHAATGLDFDEIQSRLGVATQCGRCEGCARDLVARSQEPARTCGEPVLPRASLPAEWAPLALAA